MSGARESITDVARDAADAVERCRQQPPAEAKETFRAAMLDVIRARNERIGGRSAPERPRSGELHQLNAILSLMAIIEFPLGGFHRERLDQVAQALHALQKDAVT